MLQFSFSFRVASFHTQRVLKSATGVPVGGAGLGLDTWGLGESWRRTIERAEAIENLSNEVFSRGNQHLKNVETLTALPEGLHSFPEVCFIGKPGCGKSSLISCLLHNRRLGKAGKTPGTTRLLQFFNVGDALLLVDSPGYGGWRGRDVGQLLAEQANAFSILFRYLALRNGNNLKRVYWLMESSARTQVRFQPRDEEILAFLSRERIPFSVVLTKIDRHWRHYAEQQRTADRVGKDGFVQPRCRQSETHDESASFGPEHPRSGLARNIQEVYDFLGTDRVPILGVSANREHPGRSRNLELLQHDIVYYCTQDMLPSEEPTFRNLHKLSYAPPTADSIYEVQLRYPIESFVIPQDNNMSLARMVEHHEAMKAGFLESSISAQRLSAKDLAACHLGSVAGRRDTSTDNTAPRERAEGGRLSPTCLFESSLAASAAVSQSMLGYVGTPLHLTENEDSNALSVRTSGNIPVERICSSHTSESVVAGVCGGQRFRARPQLASERWTHVEELGSILENVLEAEPAQVVVSCALNRGNETTNGESSIHGADAHAALLPDTFLLPPEDVAAPLLPRADAVSPPRPSSIALPLPVTLDPDGCYVTAIDGTPIPRSMISVSVEKLAVSKDDELAHFATKSGAGAYEELLRVDQEKGSVGSDIFMEVSDVARLREEDQIKLLETREHRTRSAARKQEERLLAKYVERKRKERSVYMQAEGYMCPWLGRSEGRNAVQGFVGSHSAGKGGAVMRELKKKGFGGKSYSARTMKNRGRSTKKTGFWAA